MTDIERITNLEINYNELRGHSFLLELVQKEMHSGDFSLDNSSMTAVDNLISFVIQKIEDLQYDLEYLLKNYTISKKENMPELMENPGS